MILAFGKLAPPESSHHAKKFGLLSLVVSVAVALGLAALGPDTDAHAVAWPGLFGRQVDGSASLESNGTTQGHRGLLASPEDDAPQLGVIAVESTSPDPVLFHGLRRLEHVDPAVDHFYGECGCSDSSANRGGLGFIEMIYIGPDAYFPFIESSMEVHRASGGNKNSDPLLYPGGDGGGSWTTDSSSGYRTFKFTFPPLPAKKISQTAFHFCLGTDLGVPDGDCDARTTYATGAESTCGDSTILTDVDDVGCYFWDLHTSCSTLLIGEEFWVGSDVYFEIVRWGDRSSERLCDVCGNGLLDSGETCDGDVYDPPGGSDCRDDCTFCGDGNVDTEHGEQCDGTPGCSSSCQLSCGDTTVQPGEECDDGVSGSESCTENCICNRDNGYYPDPNPLPGTPPCKTKACPPLHEVCDDLPDDPCICGACVEGARTCDITTEDCCGGTCIAKSDDTVNCEVQCPADMTNSTGTAVEATSSDGAVVTYTTPNIPGATVTCIQPSGSTFEIGRTTVQCQANKATWSSTCSFHVEVVDTTPPTAICPVEMNGGVFEEGMHIEATGEQDGVQGAHVSWPVPVQGTDEVDSDVTVTCSMDPGWYAVSSDPYEVTCTAFDDRGNTDDCVFTFYVDDTEPPTAICPVEMNGGVFEEGMHIEATGEQDGVQGAHVSWPVPVQGTDEVDSDVTVTCSMDPGWYAVSSDPYEVTCTAFDDRGNTDDCVFTFYVDDRCGNGSVDVEVPFNEQCDGGPDCQRDCTCPSDMESSYPSNSGCKCCEPSIRGNCPSASLIVYVEDPDFRHALPTAESYNVLGKNDCTGADIVTTSECSFSEFSSSVVTLTRKWTAAIDPTDNCATTREAICTQTVTIHCGSEPERARRVLHNILAEDEIHDWTVASSSLRSGAPFTFTKTPKAAK